jgi:hypothetical protein
MDNDFFNNFLNDMLKRSELGEGTLLIEKEHNKIPRAGLRRMAAEFVNC